MKKTELGDYVIRDYGNHIMVTDSTHVDCGTYHAKTKITNNSDLELVRFMVDNNTMDAPANNNCGHLSLLDVLSGNRHVGVHLVS